MSEDNEVCLCFHVSYRKIVNYVKIEKPKRASQISQCGGAGTGCGWCRPFLKRIFEKENNLQSESLQAKKQSENQAESKPSAGTDAISNPNFDWNSDQYLKRRENYLKQIRNRQSGDLDDKGPVIQRS